MEQRPLLATSGLRAGSAVAAVCAGPQLARHHAEQLDTPPGRSWPSARDRFAGRSVAGRCLRSRTWHPACMAKGGPLQRWLEMYVFNPLVRIGLQAGIAPRAFALLETTGRRSGARRLTPVGNGLDGLTFWIVAEHGMRCDYVKNLVTDPAVRVKVKRRWYSGTAALVADDDGLARRRQIDASNGWIGRADGVIFRASASEPVVIRIALGV